MRSGLASEILISSKVRSGATGANGFVISWFMSQILIHVTGEVGAPSRPHSASESRSSMLRPSERISLTRTLNDSGTPASKLSSPLTIDS